MLLHLIICLISAAGSRAQLLIEFMVEPQPTAVLLGQDVTLHCLATVTSDPSRLKDPSVEPELKYSWLYQHTDVSLSLNKALIFHNHTLLVPRISLEDLGPYECVVGFTDSGESAVTDSSVSIGPRREVYSRTAHIIQAYIEDFLLSPDGVVNEEGDIATLHCVSGYSAPPATVFWQKDGENISHGTQDVAQYGSVAAGGATQKSLVLQFSSLVELTGEYSCLAHNPLTGETKISKTVNVTIQAPEQMPYKTDKMAAEVIFSQGELHLLDCPIRGWPLPEITWYREGRRVPLSERVYKAGNSSIIFSPVLREDAGRYACIGANRLGSVATFSTNITVAYIGMEFEEVPHDLSVVAGSDVSLPCRSPDCFPSCSVMWYRGTEQVEERTGLFAVMITEAGNLQFSSIQLEDSGTYYCVAFNKYTLPNSRATEGAHIAVESAPLLVQGPIDKSVLKGEFLSLLCQVKGDPVPSVAWFKDANLILPSNRITIRDSGQELIVAGVNHLDEGHYRCSATNLHGTAQSQLALVDVIVPPEVTIATEDLTVAEGDSLIVLCGFYGDPVPLISWYKDGSSLITEPGSHYTVSPQGLQITAVSRHDEGSYHCVASNTGGEKEQQAYLKVHVPPGFVAYPGNKTVNVSQSVLFYCEATGDPDPSVSWLVNDSSVIPAGVEVSVDVHTLLLPSVQLSHAGTYTCVAQNILGTTRAVAMLTVQERAHIISVDGEAVVNRGSQLDLVCIVSGSPRPHIIWSVAGRPLMITSDSRLSLLEDGARLMVSYMAPGDNAEYKCTATNPAGQANRTLYVYVRDTPLSPFLNHVVAVSTYSVNVSWIPARQPMYTQLTGYIVQYKQIQMTEFSTYRDDIPVNASSTEVDSLLPAMEYVFRVAGRNSVGVGAYSNVLGTATLEAAPGPPRMVELVSQNASALRLRWEVPARKNGQLHLYQLQYKGQDLQEDYASVTIGRPSLPVQTFTLYGLEPYTTYMLRVRAANKERDQLLWGEYSQLLRATTAMKAPSSPPRDVLLTAVSSISIQVSWQPVPVTSQHGSLLGYIIYYKLASTDIKMAEHHTDADTSQVVITGLLPWRYYQVTMAAHNTAGVGTKSDVSRVRTMPQAPSAAPSDVTMMQTLPTAITVSWQPLPLTEQHSEISGYLLWYNNTKTTDSLSQYVADPNTFTAVIRNLEPWTVYSIKVQAFTTQLTDGFGPLSLQRLVKTLQDKPGPVSGVTVLTDQHHVTLSWQTPDKPNGELTAYHVLISENSTNKLRASRSVLVEYDGQRTDTQLFVVSSQELSLTISGLESGVRYSLAIAALTSVGTGPFYNITAVTPHLHTTAGANVSEMSVMTSVIPTLVDVAVTDQDVDLELAAGQVTVPPGGHLTRNELIAVVVGAVLGSLLVILLLIILLLVCCRRITANRQFVYSDSSASRSDSSTTYSSSYKHRLAQRQRNVAAFAQGYLQNCSTNTGYAHTSNSSQCRPVADRHIIQESAKQQSISVSPQKPSGGVYTVPYPSRYDAPPLGSSQPSSHHTVPPPLGYDNPGFGSTNNLSRRTKPDHGRATNHLKSNIAIRNSKRMHRTAAAAIASQQNRESSIFHDMPDTDALIGNDSVVIYNERTALGKTWMGR